VSSPPGSNIFRADYLRAGNLGWAAWIARYHRNHTIDAAGGIDDQAGILPLAKPELGIKRQCANCSAKFYDLLKKPILCPKCSTVFSAPAATVARTRRVVEEAPHEDIVKSPTHKLEGDKGDGMEEDVEIENDEKQKADDAILIEPDDEETDIGDLLGETKDKDD
jgi:uncharacterized protein (TIGR02300 family)